MSRCGQSPAEGPPIRRNRTNLRPIIVDHAPPSKKCGQTEEKKATKPESRFHPVDIAGAATAALGCRELVRKSAECRDRQYRTLHPLYATKMKRFLGSLPQFPLRTNRCLPGMSGLCRDSCAWQYRYAFRLFAHWIRRAASRVACTADSNKAIRIAMTATTTESSTNVKSVLDAGLGGLGTRR